MFSGLAGGRGGVDGVAQLVGRDPEVARLLGLACRWVGNYKLATKQAEYAVLLANKTAFLIRPPPCVFHEPRRGAYARARGR